MILLNIYISYEYDILILHIEIYYIILYYIYKFNKNNMIYIIFHENKNYIIFQYFLF